MVTNKDIDTRFRAPTEDTKWEINEIRGLSDRVLSFLPLQYKSCAFSVCLCVCFSFKSSFHLLYASSLAFEDKRCFYRCGGCNKNSLTSTRKIIPLRRIKNRHEWSWLCEWREKSQPTEKSIHNGNVLCRTKEWWKSIVWNELRWCQFPLNAAGWIYIDIMWNYTCAAQYEPHTWFFS